MLSRPSQNGHKHMQINELKILEAKGNNAVKRLRKANFERGLPFMINSRELPSNQCYLEYADGRIVLVYVKSTDARDFTFIRELTIPETQVIRTKYQLS
jgi:hypothetical protein